jgi:hypothetical protein
VGRTGIAEYYDSQPLGLTAGYRLLETRRLADGVVLGYAFVEFGFTTGRRCPSTSPWWLAMTATTGGSRTTTWAKPQSNRRPTSEG